MQPVGDVPQLMRFRGDSRFVFMTARAAERLVNNKRSGRFEFGRRFLLRRVAFPTNPSPEWFAVDLLENADRAAVSRKELAQMLGRAVRRGTFSRERLEQMTERYASKTTASYVRSALAASGE